jgi:16S rRNA (guanine527-N7)-methyltransferase
MLDQSQIYLLTEGARRLGLALGDNHLASFSLYVQELARWSKVANLIAKADSETIIRKHLLDSLAVSLLIPSDIRLLDLGSGAGFPGLVLAMVQPAREVVLIEARRKRASFLKEVVRKAKSKNVRVYEGRAETLAREDSLRNSFAAVISRATWSLKEFLLLANPFVVNGGIVLAMKGPQAEQELHALSVFPQLFGFFLQQIHEYALPFGAEQRKVLVFAKQCLT